MKFFFIRFLFLAGFTYPLTLFSDAAAPGASYFRLDSRPPKNGLQVSGAAAQNLMELLEKAKIATKTEVWDENKKLRVSIDLPKTTGVSGDYDTDLATNKVLRHDFYFTEMDKVDGGFIFASSPSNTCVWLPKEASRILYTYLEKVIPPVKTTDNRLRLTEKNIQCNKIPVWAACQGGACFTYSCVLFTQTAPTNTWCQ